MSAVKRALGGLMKPFLRACRIDRVSDVADRFRRFDVSGEGLVGVAGSAGDKLQVLVDGDLRTFTPFAFDGAAGRLSLLAFLHGEGPGARWARAARGGDLVHVFGPRGSLPLGVLPAPVVLVGDETSLGVGRALQELGSAHSVLLEASDVGATKAAAEAIGLSDVTVFGQSPSNTHIEALWTAIKAKTPTRTALVLTGNAQTIKSLRALARRDGVSYRAQKNKAYWAPGKRGLD